MRAFIFGGTCYETSCKKIGKFEWHYGSPPFDGARSGDSFVPYYIDQLNANMAFGQSVTTVPEPACMTLLVMGGLMTIVRRRR